MNLLFGKQFSRDLDNIRHDAKIKKRLMELIGSIKEAESPTDLKNIRKISEKLRNIQVISVSNLVITGWASKSSEIRLN